MRFVFILIALAIADPALGQARPPVTISQGLSMAAALKALDGRQVVAKQNGQDVVVVVPYEFSSGALRVRIARDIAILAAVEKEADDVRMAILRDILKKLPPGSDGKPATALIPNTPEWDEFIRQYGEALAQPAKGSDELLRIKGTDLRLDRNEIPVTVLSALVPILDE